MSIALPILTKPRKYSLCNGCGVCCQLVRCYFSVELIGPGPGPCPALEFEDGRAWCGLLRDPLRWVGLDQLEGWPTGWNRQAIAGELQSRLAYGLAIGSGCDAEDDATEGDC